MQTEAIIEAAITVTEAHKDWRFVPEIMVPLITDLKELNYIKGIIVAAAEAVLKAHDSDLKYMIGTMVETPQMCIRDRIFCSSKNMCSVRTRPMPSAPNL